VAFRGGWDHVGSIAAAFEIDDSRPDRYSEVTWDNYSFGFRLDAPDKERAPDVRVVSVQDGTKLRFRGCSSRLLPTGTRDRWAVGPRLYSDDALVQPAMDAAPTAPLEDAELVRDSSGWAFRSSGSSVGAQQSPLDDPRIASCSETDAFPGDFPPGAPLYYVFAENPAAIERGRPNGGTSAEATTTVTTIGAAVALTVVLGRARAAIRVWRGSSSGTYDAYADLPVGAYSTRLIDTGPVVCGYRWIRRNVPPPPAKSAQ
jgi:hypothetical protein